MKGDNVLSPTHISKCYKQLSGARIEVEDDEHPDQSVTARTEGRVQTINETVRKENDR